ncbi:MAG: hypothetical protein J6A08_12700 [Lachnospiraceae bacterium]|nr:hypothetical protein [Lachnospiraceae bacterium]
MGRAYRLKEEELAILLAVERIKKLYGFHLYDKAGMDRENLLRLLFDADKAGLIFMEGGKLKVNPKISDILRNMAEAEQILLLSGKENCPEICAYPGDKIVFMQTLRQNKGVYRIETVDLEEAVEYIQQECKWGVANTIQETREWFTDEAVRRRLQDRARILYRMDNVDILRQQDVGCCVIQYSVRQRRKIGQLLILNGILEDYILESDDMQDNIYLYSDEKAKELIGQIIGSRL